MRLINVSTWRANLRNSVPIFQLGVPAYQKTRRFFKQSSHEMLEEISILYKKIFTLYLIS